MAKKLKGITIEIGGNTTGLSNSLKDVNKVISETNYELRQVDKLLKMDPSNVELLTQKQGLLSDAIKGTVSKYEQLKLAKEQADARIASGKEDENSESYRELQREIAAAELNLNKLNDELKNNEKAMNDAGKQTSLLGDIIKGNLISDAITAGIKGLANAAKSVCSAMADIGKSAIQSYADYEQLIGGVETLFKDSSNVVEEYANNAYKSSGLSANEYMQTVTSFSASLLQSLNGDTAEAAKIADMAIVDMADNANKMGTSMDMIQNAYQGFAKQNYTMLDNLKLGYGGTKTEMERLLADAEKMPEAMGRKFNISNYADVVKAINVVQQNMKITGTTQEEASKTITGSVNSMKSAWQNMLTGIASDSADFGALVGNLVDSIVGENGEGGVLNNLLPRVQTVLDGLVNLIIGLSDQLLPQILPMGMDIIMKLVEGIIVSLPSIVSAVSNIINTLSVNIIKMLPTILQAGISILVAIIDGIGKSLPELIPAIVEALMMVVDVIANNIDLIITAGIDLILALAEGLIDAIPKLIDKIPIVISNIVEKLLEPEMLAKIITASIQLMVALGKGLVQAIPKVLVLVPKIIGELFNSIKDVIAKTDWLSLGKNMLNGILNGMLDFGSVVLNTIKKVGNKITNSIKDFFGIASPSKLMKNEVGKYLVQGIGVGVEDEMPNVINDVNNAMGALSKGVQASVNPIINTTANTNPLIIQIENFNNERETDVEAFAEELEFYRRQTALAKGGN